MAAAPGAHETRHFLPQDLKAARLGMYRVVERQCHTHIPYAAAFANGAWPSDLEYEALYQTINSTPGCAWYTRKEHSNYRSRQRIRARATASSPAPQPADPLDSTFADTLEAIPHADSSGATDHQANSSGAADHQANSLDATFTDILLALDGCSPDVHEEICVAQNPTAEQLRRWAYLSNVPAVAIFRLWDVMHPISE
ncbi:hypothetical protein TRAPUB_2363 [Trametes pubescens]|uniref:Uncharacterized protein n=1 Tax=Trametes pubescens TaxID=154538 RepID=A0A1M2VGR6_TRAPU|nr:hypothetical protein TRAPUB_2363 [Trametes pubescens]